MSLSKCEAKSSVSVTNCKFSCGTGIGSPFVTFLYKACLVKTAWADES